MCIISSTVPSFSSYVLTMPCFYILELKSGLIRSTTPQVNGNYPHRNVPVKSYIPSELLYVYEWKSISSFP